MSVNSVIRPAITHSYEKIEKFFVIYRLDKKYEKKERYVPPSHVYLLENKKGTPEGTFTMTHWSLGVAHQPMQLQLGNDPVNHGTLWLESLDLIGSGSFNPLSGGAWQEVRLDSFVLLVP